MLKYIFRKKQNKASENEKKPTRLLPADSPITLAYQGPGPYLAAVSPDSCRSNYFGWLASENPFVKTLREGKLEYTESLLKRFYDSHQYATIGDVFQISESRISTAPAMAAVMPWWHVTPEERLARVACLSDSNRYLGKEAIQFGAQKSDYGWQYFGPVSPRVGEAEFKRQLKVYKSIQERSYQPSSLLDIHGEFLVSQGAWCWVNLGGKHRFNSLVALGNKEITIAVTGKYGPLITRAEDVEHWPNVRNGNFTTQDALSIFFRILSGQSLSAPI